LDRKTFNVGKNTSLNFDQTAGGTDSGNGIAFNKVFDPSGKPSQIRGQIKADGQVYIINQNGIIFGAGSQVNALHPASPLASDQRPTGGTGTAEQQGCPILVFCAGRPGRCRRNQGVQAGRPLTADGRNGDVVVEAGASISGPVSAEGNGGRVMLVGANVRNEGTISTPSGQDDPRRRPTGWGAV